MWDLWLAKHYRSFFPPKPYQGSKPFKLIHSIVWETIKANQNPIESSGNFHTEPIQTSSSNFKSIQFISSFPNLKNPIANRKRVRTCSKHPISNFVSHRKSLSYFLCFYFTIILCGNAKYYTDALQAPELKEAILEEIRALGKNKTWIMDLPGEKKTIGCKWIFTTKYKSMDHLSGTRYAWWLKVSLPWNLCTCGKTKHSESAFINCSQSWLTSTIAECEECIF